MKITVNIIKNKNLTTTQKDTINKARIKEWGNGEKKDFKKKFKPETL